MRKLVFGCSDQVLGVLTRSEAIIQPQKIAVDLEIWVNKRYRDRTAMQKSSFSDDAGQSIPGKLSLTHTCTIRAFDLI